MRGRKPKPVERQIAEGDPRKHGVRKLQQRLDATIKAAKGLPDCPEHLDGRARLAWDFWRTELELMNMDCRPDAMMLEGACVNYARAVSADIEIKLRGITVEEPVMDREGECIGSRVKKNPAVEISNAAWRNLRAFSSEFGLSPVSRTRLTIEKATGEDEDLMTLLSQPRAAKERGKIALQ